MNIKLIFIVQLFVIFLAVRSEELGSIFIEPNQRVILAEPHTLPTLKQVNIYVFTNLTSKLTDINFIWTVIPPNNGRFYFTEGLGSIPKNSNSTYIILSTRDSSISDYDETTYSFVLERLINPPSEYSINSAKKSLSIRLLPSNYPFGLFEFPNEIPSNLTISRYSQYSHSSTLIIERKYGKSKRVLLTYDEIEFDSETGTTPINKTSRSFQFLENETRKIIDLSNTLKNDNILWDNPRYFFINLTSVNLVDKLYDAYFANATDILPRLGIHSVVYLKVVDDKSVIEFHENSTEIESNLNIERLSVSLTRNIHQNISSTNNVIVNFITYPEYSSPRMYLGYSPTYGQFIFEPNSKYSNFTFNLYHNDVFGQFMRVKFKIYLLNIQNCDSCILGVNRQSTISINNHKLTLKNLIEFDHEFDSENALNLMVKSPNQTNLCMRLIKKNKKIAFKVALALSKIDRVITVQLNDPIEWKCADIPSLTSLPNYCFHSRMENYFIAISISYVISQINSLYSSTIFQDTMKINQYNVFCMVPVYFDLKSFNFGDDVVLKNENNITKLEITLDNDTELVNIKIPLKVVNSSIEKFEIFFQLELETYLLNFMKLSDKNELINQTKSKSGIITNLVYKNLVLQNSLNFIEFILNLKSYQFYLFSFKIQILNSINSTESIQVDVLTKSMDNSTCSVVSLNTTKTRFTFVNSKRQLNLAFGNNLYKNCMVSIFYSISTSNNYIHDYIANDAENFFYVYSTAEQNLKEIQLNPTAYIDENERFLVNLTVALSVSPLSVPTNSSVFFKSISDTLLMLMAPPEISNGFLKIYSTITFVMNTTDSLFEKNNNFDVVIDIYLSRYGNYMGIDGALELFFMESMQNFTFSDKSINLNDQLVLKNRETSKKIQVSLRNFINNRKCFGDLILMGSYCYVNSENLRINCFPNQQIQIDSDGIYRFDDRSISNRIQFSNDKNDLISSENTTVISDSRYNLFLNVERLFFSKNRSSINYYIAGPSPYLDLFFSNPRSSSLSFLSGSSESKIVLNIANIFTFSKRQFYVFINGNKNTKHTNLADVTLLPSGDFNYLNIITFSQNYLMVPLFNNIPTVNLTLSIYRIGLIQKSLNLINQVSCYVKSVGFGELVPNFIIGNDLESKEDALELAHSNYDFKPVNTYINFDEDQVYNNLTISLNSNFVADYDSENKVEISKYFYIYLSDPRNGAKLMEPSSSFTNFYSPFIKIEMRKFQFNYEDNSFVENLRIGFMQSSSVNLLNQTIKLAEFNYTYKYIIRAEKPISSVYINKIYQIKWRADVVGLDYQANDTLTIIQSPADVSIKDLLRCSFYFYLRNEITSCEDLINCDSTQLDCNFNVLFRQNVKLYKDHLVRFQLFPIKYPQFGTNFLNLSIRNDSRIAYLYLKANSKYLSSVNFNKNSLISLNNKLKLTADLLVQRNGQLNETVKVFYTTREFNNLGGFDFYGMKMYAADNDYDFEAKSSYLIFDPLEQEKLLRINLRASIILNSQSDGSYLNPVISHVSGKLNNTQLMFPRMFQVILVNCTPNCYVPYKTSISNVTIITEYFKLWSVYKQVLGGELNLNLNELSQRSLKLDPILKPIETDLMLHTLQRTINQQLKLVISDPNDISFNQSFFASRRKSLLGILCNLMNPQRKDLNGKIKYFNLLDDLLFANLDGPDAECSKAVENFQPERVYCVSTSFTYACKRVETNSLKFINYSSESFEIKMFLDETSSNSCVDTCFVEFNSTNWIGETNSKKLLDNRILSISARQINKDTNKYESVKMSKSALIKMLFKKSIQTNKKCSIFNMNTGEWDYDYCQTRRLNKGIECSCSHRSIYGVTVQNDGSRYDLYDSGWFYFSVILKIFCLASAVLTYFLSFKEIYSYLSLCFIQIMISVILMQIVYLIVISLSPKITVEEPKDGNGSCIVLSLFFHYFILTQFTWILMWCLGHYLTYVIERNINFRFILTQSLTAWLSPIPIIGIFYLITGIVYENSYDYSAYFIYSDITENSDICFIKSIWAYLGGLVFPCIIMFISSISILFIYIKNAYNWWLTVKDLKQNLAFIILITLLNIIMFVHIRLGSLWLFILFCIIEITLGIYVLIFFTIKKHIALLINSYTIENERKQKLSLAHVSLISNEYNSKSPKMSIIKHTSEVSNDENNKEINRQHHLKSLIESSKDKESEEELELKSQLKTSPVSTAIGTTLSSTPSHTWINSQYLNYNNSNSLEPNRAYIYFDNINSNIKKKDDRNCVGSTHQQQLSSSSNNNLTYLQDEIFQMDNKDQNSDV